MTDARGVPTGAGEPRSYAPRRGILGWVMFDFALQPFFTLIATFVYAPYFASAVAGDPVRGQAYWGFATAAAGLTLAALSPVLGAIADAAGARKPWIGLFATLMAAACVSLWWGRPGAAGADVLLCLVAFGIATVAAELATVFNNAMMPSLVPAHRLGRLSGLGWAVGYVGGLLSLLVVLGFLAADPATGLTLAGGEPLFGLDPALREGDRASGPFTALWAMVFLLPLMLFTPDSPRSGRSLAEATRAGLGQLAETLREARRRPSIVRFLAANMIYQDGLVALFAFGGIYGAGVFGWTSIELGLFGILLTVTGTAGALIGGRLDDLVGARPVILGALAVLMIVCVGILSLGRDTILFVIAAEALDDPGGLFDTVPERVFLGLGLIIGAVAGPLQASSRSLLARMVPPAEAGRYFGLLALSGKVTSFLGPFLVALATQAFGTQAAGPGVLIVFFALGFLLISGVREERGAP